LNELYFAMSPPIHIAITRRVKPGREREFEQELLMFGQRSLAGPGARGVHFIYPAPGSGSHEYGILRTFASNDDRDAFYRSELYREWLATVESLVDGGPVCRELQGLEAWFRASDRSNPPRWKMALLTWAAVWPVSMAVPALLAPVIGSIAPNFIFAGAVAAGIVLVLTWLAMPVLVRLARPWLQPRV
jgi:antibiotic biosynthesis monooxygenase (ABM) superfamily enzyme